MLEAFNQFIIDRLKKFIEPDTEYLLNAQCTDHQDYLKRSIKALICKDIITSLPILLNEFNSNQSGVSAPKPIVPVVDAEVA